MSKLILISGKQGSGKTSIAETLALDLLPKNYVEIKKFAGVLYELEDMIWYKMESMGIKPKTRPDKRLLQLLGTEWGREHIDQDIWVKALSSRVDSFFAKETSKPKICIVDDCRFENELTYFPEAFSVRLECTRDVRKKRTPIWRDTDEHSSETGLDNFSKLDKFDLYVNTDELNIMEAVALIIKAL